MSFRTVGRVRSHRGGDLCDSARLGAVDVLGERGGHNNLNGFDEMKIEEFLERLQGVTSDGKGGWMACCPAHDDHNPSMHVNVGDDGRILVKCFAGCTADDIVAAMGLEKKDLMADDGKGDTDGAGKATVATDGAGKGDTDGAGKGATDGAGKGATDGAGKGDTDDAKGGEA